MLKRVVAYAALAHAAVLMHERLRKVTGTVSGPNNDNGNTDNP